MRAAKWQPEHVLTRHPADRLLFGSDSPWLDQQKTVDDLRSFALDRETEIRVLGGNAAALLNHNA